MLSGSSSLSRPLNMKTASKTKILSSKFQLNHVSGARYAYKIEHCPAHSKCSVNTT